MLAFAPRGSNDLSHGTVTAVQQIPNPSPEYHIAYVLNGNAGTRAACNQFIPRQWHGPGGIRPRKAPTTDARRHLLPTRASVASRTAPLPSRGPDITCDAASGAKGCVRPGISAAGFDGPSPTRAAGALDAPVRPRQRPVVSPGPAVGADCPAGREPSAVGRSRPGPTGAGGGDHPPAWPAGRRDHPAAPPAVGQRHAAPTAPVRVRREPRPVTPAATGAAQGLLFLHFSSLLRYVSSSTVRVLCWIKS